MQQIYQGTSQETSKSWVSWNKSMGILHWDQEVIMPRGATQARAGQIASSGWCGTCEKQTDPKIGELLDQLESGSSQ